MPLTSNTRSMYVCIVYVGLYDVHVVIARPWCASEQLCAAIIIGIVLVRLSIVFTRVLVVAAFARCLLGRYVRYFRVRCGGCTQAMAENEWRWSFGMGAGFGGGVC